MRRYPVQPLLDLSGLTYSALLRGKNGEAYRSIRENGLTPYMADQLAVKAGFHPSDVWETWADDEFAELSRECRNCRVLFVPSCDRNVYCSDRCRSCFHVREYRRRRYQNDPEYRAKVIEKSRRYREEAHRAIQVSHARYREQNRELLAAKERARHAANRDVILARRRARKEAA